MKKSERRADAFWGQLLRHARNSLVVRMFLDTCAFASTWQRPLASNWQTPLRLMTFVGQGFIEVCYRAPKKVSLVSAAEDINYQGRILDIKIHPYAFSPADLKRLAEAEWAQVSFKCGAPAVAVCNSHRDEKDENPLGFQNTPVLLELRKVQAVLELCLIRPPAWLQNKFAGRKELEDAIGTIVGRLDSFIDMRVREQTLTALRIAGEHA